MSVHAFFESLPFEADPFQIEAAEAVEAGQSVIVTAPTGAGKTLVAEAAVDHCLRTGRRAFYTTPLKALSNQKYGDFVSIYGPDRVGLLTGDNSINGHAPVVVMTTEVLRNMIYAGSADIDDLSVVVLDEVHYLQDRFRGAVWEEVIIHAPRHVQMVALSATVSNPGEFTDWVTSRRGPTRLVIEETRPVPLESMYAIKDLRAHDENLTLESMFIMRRDEQTPNPAIGKLLQKDTGRRRRFAIPRRLEVLDELAARNMLPAIYFIFSRAACEDAAAQIASAGARLTSDEERSHIRERAYDRTAHLPDEDLAVLEFDRWLAQIEAGVAPHHAGMVPAFKETVEELFASGHVKLVFATETLSLGINMPARSVVLERLSKFTGEGHELLLPGEYTQLTGRAGRRGIDTQGYGITLYSPYVRFDRVAAIAKAGSHPLQSSFRPSYNMTVNLVANYERERAEELLRASFGQFQRDRGLRRLDKAISRNERRLEEARSATACTRGDTFELLDRSSRPAGAGSRKAVARAAEALPVGTVVEIPHGRRTGRYAIAEKRNRKGGVTFEVVDSNGVRGRLRARDLPVGTEKLGRVPVPRPFPPVTTAGLTAMGEQIADIDGRGTVIGPPRSAEAEHPVAQCDDAQAHLTAARRVRRLERELERQHHRRSHQDEGLVGELRRVLTLLEDWGYLTGWQLTEAGDMLRSVYNDLDLLLVESIRRGLPDRMQPEELASFVAAFVYDPRADDSVDVLPTPEIEDAWDSLLDAWDDLNALERETGVPESRRPEAGFGGLAYHWAKGVDLSDLLEDHEMAAGDFVRTSRQILDVLRQIGDAAPHLSDTVRDAITRIDRGVVAAGGLA